MASNTDNIDDDDSDDMGDSDSSTVSSPLPIVKKKRVRVEQPALGGQDPDQLGTKVQQYMDQYDALSNDPKYQQIAPPDEKKQLADAIDKANTNYQDRTNTNDWLEVAQMLGRAGVQYAAARSGMKSGVDLGNIKFDPGIDYSKKNDQALDQYKAKVNTAKDLNDAGKLDYTDLARERDQDYAKKSGYLKEALDAARAREAEMSRYKRSDEVETRSNNREDARQGRQDQREADQQRKLELSDLSAQNKTVADQMRSTTTLSNNMSEEDDVSSRDASKLRQKYGATAANAGFDLDELQKTDKPGTLWGTNADPQARIAMIKGHAAKLAAALQQIRTRMDQVRKSIGQPPNPPQAPQAQPADNSGDTDSSDSSNAQAPDQAPPTSPTQSADPMITARAPNGRTIQILKSVYDSKYSGKPGFSIVQ